MEMVVISSKEQELRQIAEEIRDLFTSAELKFKRGFEDVVLIGEKCIEAKAKCKSTGCKWTEWVDENLDITIQQVNKYVKVSKEKEKLKVDFQKFSLEGAVKQLSSGNDKPFVSHNTGNDEWFTPPYIIEKAKEVMGGIDLDPASSDAANEIVGAWSYYTIDDDGLQQEWRGRVWLNPPYSQPIIKKFIDRLVDSVESGMVPEAIVLVNNATETRWCQRLLAACNAVCFIKGRIRFIDEEGNPSGAPLQGQVLIYFGGNTERFRDEVSDLGVILCSGE